MWLKQWKVSGVSMPMFRCMWCIPLRITSVVGTSKTKPARFPLYCSIIAQAGGSTCTRYGVFVFMRLPLMQSKKMDNSECAINLYGWNYLALISANTQMPRIGRIYSVDGEGIPFKEWVTTISLLLVISLLAKIYNILEKSKEIENYFWGFFSFIASCCI